MTSILKSYLDESSDRTTEAVLCVGGFLADEQHLKAAQEAWLERLKEPDEISYFRAASCKRIDGPFSKLRHKYGRDARSVADKMRADLEAILLSCPWIGFGIAILVPDYNEIWKSFPAARRFYQKNPVEAAFGDMFYTIARATQENAPDHQVAYFIDDSTSSRAVIDAFKGVRANHQALASSMATISPLDDKKTPPLQMADLIASIVKDVFLEWLKTGKPEHVPLEEKWHSHFQLIGKWDKEYMLTSLAETLGDKRYGRGELASRPIPEPTMRDLKRKRKRTRKALIAKVAPPLK